MKQTKFSYTFELFSIPSFFCSVAKTLDLGNQLDAYNVLGNEDDLDSKALSSDWHQVGTDILRAMEHYEYGE